MIYENRRNDSTRLGLLDLICSSSATAVNSALTWMLKIVITVKFVGLAFSVLFKIYILKYWNGTEHTFQCTMNHKSNLRLKSSEFVLLCKWITPQPLGDKSKLEIAMRYLIFLETERFCFFSMQWLMKLKARHWNGIFCWILVMLIATVRTTINLIGYSERKKKKKPNGPLKLISLH